jgi:hypothetical protein
MFVIEDERHAEWIGQFPSRDDALAELGRFANVPWNQAPNAAPCSNSANCGRSYEIIEYDTSDTPWSEVSRHAVLEVSATEVRWH